MNKTKIVKLVLVGTSLSAISHVVAAQTLQNEKPDSTLSSENQHQAYDSVHHSTYHSYGNFYIVNRWNYLFHRCDDGYHPFRVFHSQHYLNGQPANSQPHYHQKSLAAAQPSNQSSNSNANSRATRGGFGSSALHSSSAAA